MWLIVTFVVNSGLNFLLSLAVAAVLGPEEYGRFAVAFMAAVVASTFLFDWLRLSATRFYGSPAPEERAVLRSSLDAGYLGAVATLALAAVLVLLLGIDLRLTGTLLALAAASAATSGAFEYAAALARALFLNRAYGRLTMLKNGLAFATMIGAGWLTGSAAWVLGMFSASAFAATLTVRGALADPDARLGAASQARVAAFARYGWPIVAANLAYQGIVLLNRVVATDLLGYGAAGQLSLATDVVLRILLAAGAALDVFLFQLAVHRGATEGSVAANLQVARNMTLLAAALVGLAILFGLAMPAFEAIVVPARYRGEFGPIGMALLPGALAFCLIQFALSPVFQVAGRTAPVLWTALVAVSVDAALLIGLPSGAGLTEVAWVHSAALVGALVVACALAWRVRDSRPAIRDIGAVALAAALVLAVLWPLRQTGSIWLLLGATSLCGAPLYLGILIACDVAGLRGILAQLAARTSRRRPAGLTRGRA